jgi:hypothetical protein
MRRRTFDVIASSVGLLLALLLAVAGGFLWWAYTFTNNEVHDQLVAQKIVFPEAGSDSITSLPKEDQDDISKYAGQTMDDGAMAQAYADHYIAVHLDEIAGGKTYSQVSSEALADPNNEELAGQKAALFQGETLRGLLLNAWGFWQLGQIAMWSAIVSWIGAVVMLILAVLGFIHTRRTPEDKDLLTSKPKSEPSPA